MSELLAPGHMGSLKIPNRFVRSATGERACTEGRIPDTMIRFYERLAASGAGLIITGHAYVRAAGDCYRAMTGADRDELVTGLSRLAAAVHGSPPGAVSKDGLQPARIALQINHCGARPAEAINDWTGEQITQVIAAFAAAAQRARSAGFDAVQVHAAHGFLLSQFAAPTVNRRTDGWGGLAVPAEAVRAVRAAVGPDFPVLVKMNCDGLQPRSLTLDQSAAAARALMEAGADALEISGAEAAQTGIRKPDQEAYFAPYAQAIRQAVEVPVILVGGLRSWRRMEQVLARREADFVSLCRPFIREPDLIRRMHAEIQAGLEDAVAACTSCGRCWSSPATLNRCGALEPAQGAD